MERDRERNQKLELVHIDALLGIDEEASSPFMPSWMREAFNSLAFLKAFLMDPPQQFAECGVLQKLQSLAREVDSIVASFDLKKMDENMAADLDVELLSPLAAMSSWTYTARMIYGKEVKPSRIYYPETAQVGVVDDLVEKLEDLVKAKADLLGPLKPYILQIHQKLHFLSSHLLEIPDACKEEAHIISLVQGITNMAYQVDYSLDSFFVGDIPIWYCLYWLLDILEELECIERQVRMDSGDMLSIVSSIVKREPNIVKIIPIVNNTGNSEKVRQVFNNCAIYGKFAVCTWSLVSSYKKRKEEVLFDLLHNASYAQFVKDNYKVKGKYTSDMREHDLEGLVGKLLYSGSYLVFLDDVKDIDELNDIRKVFPNCHGSTIVLTTRSPELIVQCRYSAERVILNKLLGERASTSYTSKPEPDDNMVGFKEEMKRMQELLIRGPKQLLILSVVGMPGQGKTTLAKKLYNDFLVAEHFDIRAWGYISQVYKKKDVLLDLLGCLVQLSNTILSKPDEELSEMLYKHLKGQRFLIFLDDIWNTTSWIYLARCFPNDNNGSRIVFTSRMQELASQAKSNSILQPLGRLSVDESWELLKVKLFQKESCPPELLEIGRKIANNCKGLPLSIVLTAGILGKKEKKEDQWKRIGETLGSRILGNAEAWSKGIIELSYKNLPNHLKPCFLYFGAFSKDREVPVWKLIWLWIAEGFIKHTDSKTLEDVAEDYLMDLISRSLVTVAQEKSNCGVKTCHVHDLLREFCLTKAREERFLQQIHGYHEHFSSSNDNLDCALDRNYSYFSAHIIYHLPHLCIYTKMDHFIMSKPSGPFVRSLFFFPSSSVSPGDSYDLSFISQNFKLLRILDLEDINIGDSLQAIRNLVHLRYLAIQGYVEFIPSSIADLWNLETFLFKGLRAKIVRVSSSILGMTKLRHLHVNDIVCFDLDSHRLENSVILDNLQTFSTPILAYGNGMEKIMRRLQGIQKLKCIFLDSWDNARNCNQFPELGFLNKLVSLKVLYNGERKYPCAFHFPSNLKKLTLSNFQMPWNEISKLATLRNLEVLKLLSNAFEGERWEMDDEVFPKLKFLKLDTLDVVEWTTNGDHFPLLKRLRLQNCEQLEEIPSIIGEIPTLEMIEVRWCSPSAANSAKIIQLEQLEFGNEELKVHIHPWL